MENKKHLCEQCKLRHHYEKSPKSLIGRFWRWHINFCPGWKAYYSSLEQEKKNELKVKYGLK